MTITPGHTDAIPHDAEGRLAADVACLTCGYNLRSRMDGDACPECGVAVRDTLDALVLGADPRWFVRVRNSGVVMLIASAIVMSQQVWMDMYFPGWQLVHHALGLIRHVTGPAILIVVGVMLLRRCIATRAVSDGVTVLLGLVLITLWWNGSLFEVLPFMSRWLGQFALVAFLIAAWFFTIPQPGDRNQIAPRIALVLWAASFAATHAVRYANVAVQPLWMILNFNLMLFHIIAVCLLIRHGAALARRLQTERVADRSRIVMWGYAISGVMELSVSAVVMSMAFFGASPDFTIGLTAWAIFSIGLWSLQALFACWAWMLLLKLTRRLRALTQDRRLVTDHSP